MIPDASDISGASYKCGYPQKNDYWMKFIWPWIDLSIFSFIPVTTLVTLSSLIIYKLIKQRYRMTKIESSSQRQITISLVAFCTVMVICNTPIVILNLLTSHLDLSTPQKEADYELALSIVTHLLYVNYTINFFLYIVTTKRFRRELLAKLRLTHAVFPLETRQSAADH